MKTAITSIALAASMSLGPTQAAQIAYTEPATSTGNNFTLFDRVGGLIQVSPVRHLQ
jgi:hypothetical protein